MQQSGFSIGIDLGGTSTRVGLFDENLSLKGMRTVVTRVADGPDSAVAEMAASVAAILAEARLQQTPCIGIGSPGPIDLRGGILGLLPNLPGWENFPLRRELEAATSTVVVLESDANAAALGEWKLGAGRTPLVDSMAMITLGTGVGSGLILNGRIWHGMAGMAGEIGHATVFPEGDLCPCGSKGCMELYACAAAVVRFYRECACPAESTEQKNVLPATLLSAHSIALLAEQGNYCANVAYQRLGRFLGIGIANLISTLDLPLIVIGGGVAEAWNLFADSMFQAVADYSMVYRLARPEDSTVRQPDRTHIVPADLGPMAGLLGAALLPALSQATQSSNLDEPSLGL